MSTHQISMASNQWRFSSLHSRNLLNASLQEWSAHPCHSENQDDRCFPLTSAFNNLHGSGKGGWQIPQWSWSFCSKVVHILPTYVLLCKASHMVIFKFEEWRSTAPQCAQMEEMQKYSVSHSNDYHNIKLQINGGGAPYVGCLKILFRHE